MRTLMLVRVTFYVNGRHVLPGEQVVMQGEDVGITMRSGLAAPIRLVED